MSLKDELEKYKKRKWGDSPNKEHPLGEQLREIKDRNVKRRTIREE